jgi:Skp family chaperone for outer membrane proteins
MAGRLRRAIILAVSIVALNAASAAAADLTPAYVAFVDVQSVLRDTQAARALRSRIEAEQFTYQSELAKEENTLRAASEQLAAERESLPEADYLTRRQDIERRVEELRRQSQLRKRELELAYNEGMDRLRAAMAQVVAEIAGERGFTVVLNKANVVLGASELDITQEAIERIDATLPTLDAEAPQ